MSLKLNEKGKFCIWFSIKDVVIQSWIWCKIVWPNCLYGIRTRLPGIEERDWCLQEPEKTWKNRTTQASGRSKIRPIQIIPSFPVDSSRLSEANDTITIVRNLKNRENRHHNLCLFPNFGFNDSCVFNMIWSYICVHVKVYNVSGWFNWFVHAYMTWCHS